MRLVEVADVPGAGLDPDAVGDAARGVRADAGAVRGGGDDVAGAWAGLGASYEAPEAAQLLRVMDPVRADTDRLADELERVAGALLAFAGVLREVVSERDRLRVEVAEFRARVAAAPVGGAAEVGPASGFGPVSGLGGVSAVGLDPVLATQNAFLTARVTALAEDLAEAERACAAAVRAIDGWQERAAGLLFDTARGVSSDRMPWGDSGGPESCAGQAIEQVTVGLWSSASWATFASAYPVLSKLSGPGVSPLDQQAAWAAAGRSLIGWGVSEAEGLVSGIGDAAESVLNWTSDQADALWQVSKDTAIWTAEANAAAWLWVGDRADSIGGSWADVGDATSLLWNATVVPLVHGEDPKFTEVAASDMQLVGSLLDAAGTTLSYGVWDVDLAGDGQPAIGEPITYDGTKPGQEPPQKLQTVADVLLSISDAYKTSERLGERSENEWDQGYIRVTKISPSDGGEPVVVVSVPGTQPWFPWNDPGNDQPADFIGNVYTAAGGRSTMTESVEMAIDRVIADDATLSASTPIMLAGHSQGGMTAADLASDPEFLAAHNVTDLVTVGSPIDNTQVSNDVRVLEIQHAGDLVPLLDTENSTLQFSPGSVPLKITLGDPSPDGEHHTKITLPTPDSEEDLRIGERLDRNHSYLEYARSVQENMESVPKLLEYQNQIDGTADDSGVRFLNSEGEFSVIDVPIVRKG
ncbi:hypothetical protein [Promicromonospora sp. NPDC023987]|uniref:PGAP1-like alpha/beta domain-containing protein n=1 Tax=Promicromonospora sp. NPDC023987 TaxID=3155360 RepID=UPI0033E867BD